MNTLADRLTAPSRVGKTISLRLDETLLSELDARSSEFGVKRHKFISEALRFALDSLDELENGKATAKPSPAKSSKGKQASRPAGKSTKKRSQSAKDEQSAGKAQVKDTTGDDFDLDIEDDDLDLDDELDIDELDAEDDLELDDSDDDDLGFDDQDVDDADIDDLLDDLLDD